MKRMVLMLAVLPMVAQAAGAVVRLDAKAEAALRARVEADRLVHATAFANVQHLRERVFELDQKKRGPLAPLSPTLKALGVDALYPLLDAAALSGAFEAGAKPSAVLAWQLGVLEALGSLRAVEAKPVLLAALARPDAPTQVTRAAAEALGKLGSDDVVDVLLRAARADGPHGLAVVQGLGACRRLAIAEHVATTLETADEARALVLVRVLGQLGNAWGWQTPDGAPRADERDALAKVIGEALGRASGHRLETVRAAAAEALAIVKG